jgi:hypothetical protein
VSAAFIMLTSSFIMKEMFWFMLLPVVLLVALSSCFPLTDCCSHAFFTPLAITYTRIKPGFSVSLPTDLYYWHFLILFCFASVSAIRFR